MLQLSDVSLRPGHLMLEDIVSINHCFLPIISKNFSAISNETDFFCFFHLILILNLIETKHWGQICCLISVQSKGKYFAQTFYFFPHHFLLFLFLPWFKGAKQ